MYGVDLNGAIRYICASLRVFVPGERHTTRFCRDNVLLLVYEGVLRFSEDGVTYAVTPGCYHIQKKDSYQREAGACFGDEPKYLYIHFDSDWSEGEAVLAPRGHFDYRKLQPLMERMDSLEHHGATYVEKCAVLLEILSELYVSKRKEGPADRIAAYLRDHCEEPLTLTGVAEEFHYSPNGVIHLFKQRFGLTPFAYLRDVRLRRAEQLLTETARSAENIAFACGFADYTCFYKAFVEKNELSPAKWRSRTLGE